MNFRAAEKFALITVCCRGGFYKHGDIKTLRFCGFVGDYLTMDTWRAVWCIDWRGAFMALQKRC